MEPRTRTDVEVNPAETTETVRVLKVRVPLDLGYDLEALVGPLYGFKDVEAVVVGALRSFIVYKRKQLERLSAESEGR